MNPSVAILTVINLNRSLIFDRFPKNYEFIFVFEKNKQTEIMLVTYRYDELSRKRK